MKNLVRFISKAIKWAAVFRLEQHVAKLTD